MPQGPSIARLRDTVPPGAYRESLAVRSYEVGRDGCVHAATLLRYLEHLATRASAFLGYDNMWYERHGQAWVIREMLLWLGEPPHMGDEIKLATWVSAFRRVQAYRECAAWYAGSGRRVARARGRWGYIDRQSLQLARVPEAIIRDCPVFPLTVEPRRLPEPRADAAGEATLDLTARRYEADSQLHINNCVYVDWLEEALHTALGKGQPEDADVRWPRYYHLEYVRPLWPGDRARITTRWQQLDRRRLLVEQEIVAVSDGSPAVRARSVYLRPLAPQPATVATTNGGRG